MDAREAVGIFYREVTGFLYRPNQDIFRGRSQRPNAHNGVHVSREEVTSDEVHAPSPVGVEQLNNPSKHASAWHCDRCTRVSPGKPPIPPNSDLLAIANSPNESLFKEVEAMLNSLPGR